MKTLSSFRHPTIHRGLTPRLVYPHKFSQVEWLCKIADAMAVGDAVELRLSEAQTMRVILNARGFQCISDGWSCKTPGMVLIFKWHPITPKAL